MVTLLLNLKLKYKFWLVNAVAFLVTLSIVIFALIFETQGQSERIAELQTTQLEGVKRWSGSVDKAVFGAFVTEVQNLLWLQNGVSLSADPDVLPAPALAEIRRQLALNDRFTTRLLVIQPEALLALDNIVVSAMKLDAHSGILLAYSTSPTLFGLLLQRARDYAPVVAVLMIVLLVASQLLISFIERHVNKLKQVMVYVQQNKDLTARVPIDSTDEVGDMADAFNKMQIGRQETMTAIREAAQTLQQTSRSLVGCSDQSARSIAAQQMQTDMLASAMTQMLSAANEIADRALETQQISSVAADKTHQGAQLVSESKGAIDQLSGQVNQASERVQMLNRDSHEIEDATSTIRTIADQTNLLALNAAIEAARAGESGRGFAVVADEVRKLAIHSQTSTDKIHEVVQRIRSAAHDVRVLMQQSHEQTNVCVTAAEQAARAMDDVSGVVAQVNDKSMLVASAAEEQSQTSREINENIAQIREGTRIADLNTSEVIQNTQDITTQVEKLFNRVQQMKVE
ncbi:MAG: methyl-accepting chemotaxis protein [Pseudomonadales bacterium]|nr:methyl-accepting chemotaxis protein [Pseudomonadales bacterium]